MATNGATCALAVADERALCVCQRPACAAVVCGAAQVIVDSGDVTEQRDDAALVAALVDCANGDDDDIAGDAQVGGEDTKNIRGLVSANIFYWRVFHHSQSLFGMQPDLSVRAGALCDFVWTRPVPRVRARPEPRRVPAVPL